MNYLHTNLRKFRKSLGFTQQEIANEMSVSLSSYRRYENGELPIPSDKIEILVLTYELNATWLFTGRGQMRLEQRKLSEPIRNSAESDYSIPGEKEVQTVVSEFRHHYTEHQQEILSAVITLLQAIRKNT